MAGRQLAALSRRLLAAGWPADTPVLRGVARRLARPDRAATTRVATLAAASVLHSRPPDRGDRGRRCAASWPTSADPPSSLRPGCPHASRKIPSCAAPDAAQRARQRLQRHRRQPHPTSLHTMTHVVLESCIRCKYTDCVDVCPVDCFREGPEHPDDRPRRVHRLRGVHPRVPGQRDHAEEDVPGDQQHFIKLNAELAQEAGRASPSASRRRPMPTNGRTRPDKLPELIR